MPELQTADEIAAMMAELGIDQADKALRWQLERERSKRLLDKLFDESQHPRDDHGRWTDAGGVAFISPNVEDLDFGGAVSGLKSERQATLKQAGIDVDKTLGKEPVEGQHVVGAWSDGAENSIQMVMPKGWTHGQARVAVAMKAWLGDQKAALLFTPDHAGNGFIATVPVTGELADIHKSMLDAGLAFHTLEPISGGALVHVYGEDQETADKVDKVAKDHGVKAEFTAGQGEFIGTDQPEGDKRTDRKQRDDARAAYEAIIRSPEAGAEFGGRDVAKAWEEIRGRWGAGLSTNEKVAGASERVSTTVPSAKKQGIDDPHQRQDLSPSYSTFHQAMKNPKYAEGVSKMMDRYGASFLRLPPNATPEQKAEAFVQHAASNLKALYDAQDPKLRGRSATWYTGARKIAEDFGKEYNVSPRAVAGVLASLSPQRDWDQNVEMARRVLDIAVKNRDVPITGEKFNNAKTSMLDYAKQQLVDADKIQAKLPENPDPKDPAVRGNLLKIENRRDMAGVLNELANKFEGKKLSELPLDEQAMVLRFYDEGNAAPNRAYTIWNPEGTPSGTVGMAGKPGKEKVREAGWGGFGMTENALSILADDTRANISSRLGDNHKVRNFYNNIIAPDYGKDATIDTHAIAGALLMPLGGSDVHVKEGLGMSGPKNADTGLKSIYALYNEAYRRAADERGVLPREMQSTTWEALRGLFSPEEKRDAKLDASVKSTWKQYKEGKIDLAAAQQAILSRGIKPPRWAK